MTSGRKIKNFTDLAATPLRKAALEIAEAGLWAIDTESVIQNMVSCEDDTIAIAGEKFERNELGRIIVAGVGKCALAAAHAIEDILGERVDTGVIIDVRTGIALKKIQALKGTHPAPSRENVENAETLVKLLNRLTENDLVIFIVSGGGSTLLCLPEDEGCEEEERILHDLTSRGAAIREINTVRKHMSLARGGHLAKYAYPARVISLIFSDVPGDETEFVASGPTIQDSTTIEDAAHILTKYDILETCRIPNCGLIETPKEEKYFTRVKNILAVSNRVALRAMQKKAEALGYAAHIRDTKLAGEARIVAKRILDEIHGEKQNTALFWGGETTVTLAKDHGRGGRNLEMALAGLPLVKDNELLLPLASDGRDNGEYAGAICDSSTRASAEREALDTKPFLAKNNEYPFFEKVGNYLLTGDTGSNVSDLIMALKE